MPRAAAPPPPPERQLEFYGLDTLGYGDIPLTGNYVRDQFYIESICFRIGLKPNLVERGLGKYGHFKRIVDLLWNNPEVGSSKKCIFHSWAERIFRKMCEHPELGIAGPASAGKSDPAALWAVVNYIVDPTHTMVMVMSTTLGGAKKRIWKTLKEYWEGIPNLPGKPLWSTNEIRGLTYSGKAYGDSSGIYLMASEQSNEKTAMDKLIGIKAPRTGEPDESYESLSKRPEYADLVRKYDEDYLRDLLPRLQNLSDDRIGQMILIIDEATGCSESIRNVINTNMKPGNSGHFQSILIGNPHTWWDTFGLYCEPETGWPSVTLNDDEWETKTGGLCIRFNAEQNPRIVDGNEKLSWMPRKKSIDAVEKEYGRNSLFFYRMILGMWSPNGSEEGVYNQADFAMSGSMEKTIWGFEKPITLSALDPAFAADGDRASCTFAHYGIDVSGKYVLELTEEIPIKVDNDNTAVPVSYQMVRKWREECIKRGVGPTQACFDSTGGGITFADVVRMVWSSQVLAITSAGKASKTPVGYGRTEEGDPILCSDRYANKATELWYGAHPFLRSGQIRGITSDLAKQICTRQHDKGGGRDARVLKVEGKRIYKAREGSSPDQSDSFFLLPELAKQRFKFRPSEKAAVEKTVTGEPGGNWNRLCDRARKLSSGKRLS